MARINAGVKVKDEEGSSGDKYHCTIIDFTEAFGPEPEWYKSG
jgi:hypothetical protein